MAGFDERFASNAVGKGVLRGNVRAIFSGTTAPLDAALNHHAHEARVAWRGGVDLKEVRRGHEETSLVLAVVDVNPYVQE